MSKRHCLWKLEEVAMTLPLRKGAASLCFSILIHSTSKIHSDLETSLLPACPLSVLPSAPVPLITVPSWTSHKKPVRYCGCGELC